MPTEASCSGRSCTPAARNCDSSVRRSDDACSAGRDERLRISRVAVAGPETAAIFFAKLVSCESQRSEACAVAATMRHKDSPSRNCRKRGTIRAASRGIIPGMVRGVIRRVGRAVFRSAIVNMTCGKLYSVISASVHTLVGRDSYFGEHCVSVMTAAPCFAHGASGPHLPSLTDVGHCSPCAQRRAPFLA